MMAKSKKIILPMLIAPLFIMGAPSAYALSENQLIEGAKQCTRYITRYERQYAIPTHLLSAVSTNESGRYHKGLGISIPWPWTINVEGKGYYFDTKQEAIAAVRKHQARGARSIDVGCMQVNLKHHPDAFASLSNAFDPRYNVAYAASFLRRLHDESGSWKTAAAHYHSKTPSRGQQYAGSVYKHWHKIIGKLRAARLSTGDAPTRTVASVSKPLPFKKAETKTAALPQHRVPKMKVIQLSSKNKVNKPTIIKPSIKVVNNSTAVTVAELKPAALSVTQTISTPKIKTRTAPKTIHLRDRSHALSNNGPNFIFTN